MSGDGGVVLLELLHPGHQEVLKEAGFHSRLWARAAESFVLQHLSIENPGALICVACSYPTAEQGAASCCWRSKVRMELMTHDCGPWVAPVLPSGLNKASRSVMQLGQILVWGLSSVREAG